MASSLTGWKPFDPICVSSTALFSPCVSTVGALTPFRKVSLLKGWVTSSPFSAPLLEAMPVAGM